MVIRRSLVWAVLVGVVICDSSLAQRDNVNDRPMFNDHPVLEDVDLFGRSEESRISIVIEAGVVTPQINLLELDFSSEVTLEITSGPADFLFFSEESGAGRRVKRVTFQSEVVLLPRLVTGKVTDRDSTLSIVIDGSPASDPVIITVNKEGFFKGKLPTMKSVEPAILFLDRDAGFMIADPRRFAWEVLPQDVEELELDREGVERIYFPEGIEERCPEFMWLTPDPLEDFFPNPFDCDSNLRPFGRIEFMGSTPIGFSVKPELVHNVLIPATAPAMNFVDGLYRVGWGCNVALKIPDNVIATVFSSNASCCRGPAARIFNRRCSWIDPSSLPDWPNCPL